VKHAGNDAKTSDVVWQPAIGESDRNGIAALVVAAFTNTSVPLLGSERAVFVAVVLLGVIMCSLGGVGRAPMKYGWTHPVTLFGIAIGTIMLLLVAGVVLGQLTDQIGLMVFAALFAMKWAVGLAFVR
jgi:hypothetical protein